MARSGMSTACQWLAASLVMTVSLAGCAQGRAIDRARQSEAQPAPVSGAPTPPASAPAPKARASESPEAHRSAHEEAVGQTELTGIETVPIPGAGEPAAGGTGATAPMTGAPVPPGPPLPGAVGVMVENSWGARPQAGLDRADLVFEMEAEFGISRFLALFQQRGAPRIGPVRSSRIQFLDVVGAYRIPYAHAGGSIEALRDLGRGVPGLLNIDEIYTCGRCFWRSQDREPPHNLYTSTDLLLGRSREVGFDLTPLNLPPTGPLPEGGSPVRRIAYDWGEDSQDVEWEWNQGRYLRSQSGGPHLLEGDVRVATENLIAIFTWWEWDSNSNQGKGSWQVSIVGKGEGMLYRNGQALSLRWQKAGRADPFQLTFPDGSPVVLAPGRIWFTVLKSQERLQADG